MKEGKSRETTDRDQRYEEGGGLHKTPVVLEGAMYLGFNMTNPVKAQEGAPDG